MDSVIRVDGPWDEGYVLSMYMASSVYIGDNIFGEPEYNNTYTEAGEFLHAMKYNGHLDTSDELVGMYADFILKWLGDKNIRAVIPTPPSNIFRDFQPVYLIGEKVASLLGTRCYTNILEKKVRRATKSIPKELRNLNGAIMQTKPAKVACNILLIDDLYSSGETARACTEALRNDPMIEHIYFMAIAKTK